VARPGNSTVGPKTKADVNPALNLARSGRLPKTYGELVALHVPRPIGDKVAYDNTVAVVDALAGHALNPD